MFPSTMFRTLGQETQGFVGTHEQRTGPCYSNRAGIAFSLAVLGIRYPRLILSSYGLLGDFGRLGRKDAKECILNQALRKRHRGRESRMSSTESRSMMHN